MAIRLEPERKIPRDLATFSELSKFISENNIKLFSREDYTKYDVINYHLEQTKTDDAFFIVDLGELLEQYKLWKNLLHKIEPYFAVKSCNNPLVLKTLAVLGCNFACANKTEIINVTDLNISTNRIVFSNPVKDPQYIRFARSQNVDTLVFDNEVELYKIKLYHPYAKLILRISVDSNSSFKSLEKYGCPITSAKSLLEKARSLELDVVGVSFSVDKKNTDLDSYRNAVKDAREIFRMSEELGIRMNILDIGGGLPGAAKDSLLKFEDIARTINEAIDAQFGEMEGLKIIAEPGRYFVAKSHILAFNVIGKKKSVEPNGEIQFEYYMNDGIYGSFNCVMFDGVCPEIQVFNNKSEKRYKTILYGPTCDDMDVLTKSAEMPELGIGEWCYVEDFGAYSQICLSEYNGYAPTECAYVFMF